MQLKEREKEKVKKRERGEVKDPRIEHFAHIWSRKVLEYQHFQRDQGNLTATPFRAVIQVL